MRDFRPRRVKRPIGVLHPGEVAVKREELDLLRRKADGHDRFVEAMREMGRRQILWQKEAKEGNDFAKGWLRALREIADLVVNRR